MNIQAVKLNVVQKILDVQSQNYLVKTSGRNCKKYREEIVLLKKTQCS